MKTVIMQPYLFPYLGYWQMVANADVFVVFDDVNFIKRGWINRNNILVNGSSHLFTLPLIGASQNKFINEIEITHEAKEKKKILQTIEMAYKKAPYFDVVYPLLEEIMNYPETNLSKFLFNQFKKIFDYLDVKTKLMMSSQIDKDNSLHAQDKIIDICQRLGTTQYINAIGGQNLYDKARFSSENIVLNFIKMRDVCYPQFKNEFVPFLSIIDVLMFNDKKAVQRLLCEFDLI